ncbi:primosomal protein N' [Thiomicrorhabdus immobilis]|uniref:Replication restart protein PriA n=1 Tax=Thiomicrorhabdus immobilis TaxID=2791037 RepID=A0ABM7MAN5_9GAMM|nr:primosomal protein N' [Thiomicrorhabdus immobilis]
MQNPKIAKVAVPGPFLFPLDYLLDAEQDLLTTDCATEIKAVVGGRVWVPFRNKKVIGMVMEISESADYELSKIKPIEEVIDIEPLFDATQLGLLNWASQYYHEPIGDVMLAALPKRLRAGENAEISGMQYWQLSAEGRSKTLEDISRRALKQRRVFAQFLDQKLKSESDLNAELENWRSAVKTFTEKGWLETAHGPCLRESNYAPAPNHTLNDAQKSAVDAVLESQQIQKRFQAFLLEGITGSGKTEVYLGMIESMLKQGKQVLVLVPEIGLTPQMVSRFEAFLQTRVAALHSNLNDSERHCAWHLIRTGQIQVLLGTRSAVFTPFKNLGLCIIDEEHDLSYKQQEGFRYSARDLMVQRAYREQIPVVLGSATPSLETLHNAKTGRYTHLHLKQRAGVAKLPSLKLLDIRGEKIQEGVSRPLKTAMTQHLQAGGQALLFLNRRGFSPVLMCHDCGWQAACPSCDANMTFHMISGQNADGTVAGYLQCHHCDEQMAKPHSCPSCASEEFVNVGQGTERLEETIKEWFPDKKVLRIDRDTTRLKGSMAELTGIAQRGEADILIGTQMLAKGHHFPNVTLVGLLDIDQGLFSADFRAAERMAQLILQVSGRAGRAEKAGEVLIQTHHPDHPLLTTLIQQGYDAFATKALQERQDALLPPFKYQILIRAEATHPNDGMLFLESLKAGLQNYWQQWQEAKMVEADIDFWGPVSAPMLRRQGRYRYQLMLQSLNRGDLHRLISEMQPHIYNSPLSRKVRWSIDVDPQEMY